MATSRSRAVDHLGFIGRTLEELTGFSTLAFELIQNADDSSQGARRLRFDIRADALWVEDDGGFTDCERQELGPDKCPFLDTLGHRCDFHSFRLLSGRDKQARGDTTGAFGIGFTAVYQVADLPEIISGTRHWVVDETQPEEDRIRETLLDRPHDGTRIVLPWAYDARSPFRARIKAAPAPPDVRDQLEQALDEALAPAMLFLRHLEVIEIALNGEVVRAVTRTVEEDEVLIDDGGERRRWRLIRGDFSGEAARLRAQHDGRIEPARSPDVSIAIPIDFDNTGRVCSTLPTAQLSGLPIHVNAELYLQSDRRRLGMGAPHQHDWNTAALRCTAQLLADALGDLPDLLGPTRLWQAIRDARRLDQDEHPDAVGKALAAFWECLDAEIPEHKVVWTSNERWVSVEEARYAQSDEEEAAFPVLEALGLNLVHPVLRPLQNTLRTVGVALLGVADIAEALRAGGLVEALRIDELPAPLNNSTHRAELWVELGRLVGRLSDNQRDSARSALETAAVVPSLAGELTTIDGVWRTDAASRELLHRVAPAVPFLAEGQLPEEAAPLADLCDPMTPGDAIAELDEASLDVSAEDGRALVAWFARREVDLSDDNKKTLAQLPIFPSREGTHALTELALPGGFDDPLDLALLVDRDLSREHEAFLGRLGVPKLSFPTYATEQVPRAFARPDLTGAQRHAVVALLAQRKGQLDDEPAAHTALTALDVVECTDGTWRQPRKAYLERPEVIAVLGPTYPFAVLPHEHSVAVEELLVWLGVADSPRPADVIARAEDISEQAVTVQHRTIVERIVQWLGERWLLLQPTDHTQFEGLRSARWLPMRGSDAWHLPAELDLIYRDYLYGSQGHFLDLPQRVQTRSNAFLAWLGLEDNPTVEQVVEHLRYCAETDTQPNKEVYAFLNQHADAPEIGTLRNVASLHIQGRWLKPSEVFWTDHPFGEWRRRLGHEFARYRDLFDQLGVEETPKWPQALAVMHDISAMYAPSNAELSDDDRSILLECWRLCDSALVGGEMSPDKLGELSGRKVVADDRSVLMRPSLLYFEDLPGLADELPGIRDHVIRRPDGAWRAMRAAGVEDLSKVAIANVVDLGSRLDGDQLCARLPEREEELARVIAPGIEFPWRDLSSQLGEIRCVVVS
ncbi:MAG: hypothetical protein JWM85_1950, partial [Acidimicrobiaceae bacterium]|nr:hypothetical protein [Acidimicrobiaceae bacterium]